MSAPIPILFGCVDLGGGGAERTLVDLAKMEGVEARAFLAKEHDAYGFPGTIEAAGIDPFGRGAARGALALARLALRYWEAKGAWAPRVSVSFNPIMNVLNALSRRGERVVLRYEAVESARVEREGGRGAWALLSRIAWARADAIVAVSDFVRRDLIEVMGAPPEKITRIYNPIDRPTLKRHAAEPLDARYAAIAERGYLSTMGRLREQKGQWHLVRAFHRYKERGGDHRLVLLGEGPLERSLFELCAGLGLRAVRDEPSIDSLEPFDVIFAGFRSNPFPILSASRLFLFPSLCEGLGNAQIEAMCCGVPVACARGSGGAPEIVGAERYGLLWPAFDGVWRAPHEPASAPEESWARLIEETLRDEPLRAGLSRRGAERAAMFDLGAIREEWLALFERMERRR